MPKKRKWNDEYVRYGFTALLDNRGESDRPQCMTYHLIMCNSNLKPARLKEHQAKHPATEHEQTFQAKRARYDQRGTLLQLGFKPMQKPLLRASYEVAYQCIQVKAAHSTAENLIKPCAIRMVELVLGKEAAEMKDVPDGAPAMIGKRSGFAALLKKKVADIIVKYCFLHRHALAAKT